MTVSNNIFIHKLGENGAVLTATLSDGDGAFDTTGFTITLNVRKSESSPLLVDDAPCSGNSSGVVTCTIDDGFDTLTQKGEYLAEYKLVNGSTVLFWPKNVKNERTYFRFIVQKSLA